MDNIKAFIFDFDGVIVDSVGLHEKAEAETCQKFNIRVPQEERVRFRGKKIDEIFGECSKLYGTGNEPIDEMVSYKTKLYLKYASDELRLVPGIIDFLNTLNNSGAYRCAITTSGQEVVQKRIMEQFHLSKFFELIVTSKDVTKGKPNPEPYTITVERLQLQPNECLVIEDAVNGIRSAKISGCHACGLTTNTTKKALLEAGADIVIDSFEELTKQFKI